MNLNSLDGLLKHFEKLHPKFIDLSLNRIFKLLKKLNDPHLNLPNVIHIAGTNGKGSTLSFIKQILINHNFKVHCYISPHLESFEERFFISNKKITKLKLYKTLKYINLINNNEPITFFEITTVAAFYLFSKSNAEFLILETGLGGKLDATNVIHESILSIITPISFDHKEYLGNTLKKITNEKLGIIKKDSTVIISKQEKAIENYILTKLKNHKNRKLFYNKNYKILNIKKNRFSILVNNKKLNFNKPSLLGEHQIENASLAIIAAYELKKIGYKINKNLINQALIKTEWPGRLEKLYLNNIPFFLDGAHNVPGAKQLRNFLSLDNKKTWIIIGMLNNKDIYHFLKYLKNFVEGIIALRIPNEKNSFTVKEISNVCKELNISCIKQKNISTAKNYLLNKIKPEKVLITGSLYLVGRVKKSLV